MEKRKKDRLPNAHRRGYSRQWRKARDGFLRHYPLCAMCLQDGKRTQATVVDHIKPHKGDMKLFWDRANWQSLCEIHHSGTKQRQEKGSRKVGCDAQGQPLGLDHHWNK